MKQNELFDCPLFFLCLLNDLFFLLMTFVIFHAGNFSSLSHSLSSAAFASWIFIAKTQSTLLPSKVIFMVFLLGLSNAISCRFVGIHIACTVNSKFVF